jgi:hypothetical protein
MCRAGTSEQLTKADERRRPNKAAAADGKTAAAVLSVGQKRGKWMKIYWLILVSCFLGCTSGPLEAKRFFRNETIIKELWQQATPVQSEQEIINCWISEGTDLPANSYKSVNYFFSKYGTLTISIIYKNGDGLPAPPLVYKIKNSELCTTAATGSEYDKIDLDKCKNGPKIKKYKNLLLIAEGSDVTVFRPCKK